MTPHKKAAETTAPEIEEEDIYVAVGVERTASAEEIKKAYRKQALRLHPDKIASDASDEERAEQTKKFQRLALYYAILSDEAKRARYDATGSVEEASSSILDGFMSSGREWDEYFEELYGGIVTTEKIEEFAAKYRDSEEEKRDLIECYNTAKGDMDEIMESLILADTENEARIRDLIATLFTSGELSPTPAWKKTTTKTAIKNRASASASEALEAEQHAKDLGIHDKLFAKGGKKPKESEEETLMALMKANSERRMGALISNLETKYGAGTAKSVKRAKKAKVDESEEENMDEEEVPKKRKTKTR